MPLTSPHTAIALRETADDDAAPSPDELEGELSFASPEVQIQRTAELLGADALIVPVRELRREQRGRLAERIGNAIDVALDARDAPGAGLDERFGLPTSIGRRLADQMYRARAAGCSGIALLCGPLAAIADPALSPEDSATIRFLARATLERPLVVLLDDGDVVTAGYSDPMPLRLLLGIDRGVDTVPSPRVAERAPLVTEIVATEIAVEDVHVHLHDHVHVHVAEAEEWIEEDVDDAPPADVAPVEPEIESAADEPEPVTAADEDAEDAEIARADAETDDVADTQEEVARADAESDDVADTQEEVARADAESDEVAETASDEEHADAEEAPVAEVGVADLLVAAATPPQPPPRVEITAAPPPVPATPPPPEPTEWRAWVSELVSARGPQPLGAFERLFVNAYMPLLRSIERGFDEPRAVRALDEFKRGFERAYIEACPTFGLTARRPRLVMDVHEVAQKTARLHGARSAHVVVVDSMRFDLGCMVRARLEERLAKTASLTDEHILWAALPTITTRQLETIARGVEALRAPIESLDDTVASLRGRAAEHVRRLRVGPREVHKLDAVASSLAVLCAKAPSPRAGGLSPHEHELPDMRDLADHAAEILATHFAPLPPRTLVLVAGDHGFSIDRSGRASCGGASPEEVLVPAFSFLMGALH